MISFECSELKISGVPRDEWAVLLHVNARFRLQVSELVLIDEPSFPVIELARALISWDRMGGFEYHSMEAEVSPLLFVEASRGFYVASPLSRTCSDMMVDRLELASAVDSFIDVIREAAKKNGVPVPFLFARYEA